MNLCHLRVFEVFFFFSLFVGFKGIFKILS